MRPCSILASTLLFNENFSMIAMNNSREDVKFMSHRLGISHIGEKRLSIQRALSRTETEGYSCA